MCAQIPRVARIPYAGYRVIGTRVRAHPLWERTGSDGHVEASSPDSADGHRRHRHTGLRQHHLPQRPVRHPLPIGTAPTITNNTLPGDAKPGIEVIGGGLTSNHTWATRVGEPFFTVTGAEVLVYNLAKLTVCSVIPG